MSAEPTPTPAPEPPAAATTPEPVPSTPPWGEDFDPDRAWKTITNLREREKELSKSQLTADQRSKLDEYDRLAEASKTELERAQEAAQKAQDSITALRERAVSADLRAALTGVVPDPAALIEDLNVSRFIGADGEVDTAAIEALRVKYAALAPAGQRAPAPNPSQGSSAGGPTGTTVEQLSDADVKRLYAEKRYDDIEKARQEGRLSKLLGA